MAHSMWHALGPTGTESKPASHGVMGEGGQCSAGQPPARLDPAGAAAVGAGSGRWGLGNSRLGNGKAPGRRLAGGTPRLARRYVRVTAAHNVSVASGGAGGGEVGGDVSSVETRTIPVSRPAVPV